MGTKSALAFVIVLGLAIPVTALAQDNGSGPAVQSPMKLPGTSGAPEAQVPQPQGEPGVNWKGVGVGAGTVAGNVLYVPAKLVYGILGGVAGGAGWALTGGNTQVANTIWRSSLGGDYVLTPNMVAGKEPIHFSGPTSTAPAAPQSSAADNGSLTTANSSTIPPGPAASAGTGSGGAPAASSAAHPIDRGAGPISGGSSRPDRDPPGPISGPLPNTSIE